MQKPYVNCEACTCKVYQSAASTGPLWCASAQSECCTSVSLQVCNDMSQEESAGLRTPAAVYMLFVIHLYNSRHLGHKVLMSIHAHKSTGLQYHGVTDCIVHCFSSTAVWGS